MTTMYAKLQALLGHRRPRLLCTPASNFGTDATHFTAFIDHAVTPPLDATTLRELREQLGDLPPVLAFYERYGSARLFRDLKEQRGIGRASAYYIAPPDEWPALHSDAEDWFSGLSDDEAEEILPDWISDYVVVGEIPNSGNCYLMPLVGDQRGAVFEFEHDGFEFIERGADFEAFVEALASVDPDDIVRIGGHTRYTDGATEAQWMPIAYEHGDAGD